MNNEILDYYAEYRNECSTKTKPVKSNHLGIASYKQYS